MKVWKQAEIGDTYVIRSEDGGIMHSNHKATIIAVKRNPPSSGPDVDPGGPDLITTRCECGEVWQWEDREE